MWYANLNDCALSVQTWGLLYLKQAEEMLWKIPLKHFDWKYMDKLISETSNSLFIEEIKNSEHKTIGSLEQEKST